MGLFSTHSLWTWATNLILLLHRAGRRRRRVLDLLATAGGDEAKSEHGNEESGCASHRFLPVIGGDGGSGTEAALGPPLPGAREGS